MMSKMQQLYRLTYEAFEWLHGNAVENVQHYADQDTKFGKLLENSSHASAYREPIPGVSIAEDLRLEPPRDTSVKKRHEADSQALEFYNSFEGMTPRLASDPLVLAYINHFYLHEFGIFRWPFKENMKSKARAEKIRKHWITRSADNNTDVYQSSISGRTWWIARTALTVAEHSDGELEADEVLEKFANSAEYYHRIMQYSIFRNPLVMSEFVRSLFHEAKAATIDEYILMARDMNLKAGARLIDSFDRMGLRLMVRDAAAACIGKADG